VTGRRGHRQTDGFESPQDPDFLARVAAKIEQGRRSMKGPANWLSERLAREALKYEEKEGGRTGVASSLCGGCQPIAPECPR